MKFDEAHLVEWMQITNHSPGLCLSDIISIFFVPFHPRYRSPERSRWRNDFLSGDNPMGISRPAQATVIYPARGGGGGSGKVAASATAAVENDISDVILRGRGRAWED